MGLIAPLHDTSPTLPHLTASTIKRFSNKLPHKNPAIMTLLLLLAVGAVVGSAGAADSGLTLAVYNNTGFGGDAYSTKVIPSFDFTHPG